MDEGIEAIFPRLAASSPADGEAALTFGQQVSNGSAGPQYGAKSANSTENRSLQMEGQTEPATERLQGQNSQNSRQIHNTRRQPRMRERISPHLLNSEPWLWGSEGARSPALPSQRPPQKIDFQQPVLGIAVPEGALLGSPRQGSVHPLLQLDSPRLSPRLRSGGRFPGPLAEHPLLTFNPFSTQPSFLGEPGTSPVEKQDSEQLRMQTVAPADFASELDLDYHLPNR